MRELQVNGLPIDGKFDEMSTTDFAKSSDTFVLKPTDDEIFEFSAVKMEFDNKLDYKPITVKLFAHGKENAVKKLKDKGAEFIILNHPNDDGCGIDSNYNKVSILNSDGEQCNIKKDRKDRVAKQILDFIISKRV